VIARDIQGGGDISKGTNALELQMQPQCVLRARGLEYPVPSAWKETRLASAFSIRACEPASFSAEAFGQELARDNFGWDREPNEACEPSGCRPSDFLDAGAALPAEAVVQFLSKPAVCRPTRMAGAATDNIYRSRGAAWSARHPVKVEIAGSNPAGDALENTGPWNNLGRV
jgi:hypothetical protein